MNLLKLGDLATDAVMPALASLYCVVKAGSP
jgi:hypothetical protein